MNGASRPVRSVSLYKRVLRFINRRFVAPKVQDPEIRNREIVLNVMLVATIAVLAVAILLLCVSYTLVGHTYVLARMGVIALALGVTIGVYRLARTRHYRAAAHLLILIYLVLATLSSYRWGIDLPAGILLYALIITMSGVLLGARYSLYATGILTTMISLVGWGIVNGSITPDRLWTEERITAGAIVGFILVFSVIALGNWLFNYQIDRSLHRALRAENALMRQKLMLEIQVEKRTRQLQDAQLEKVQQMYRFAELGQLSTALLHELANHLTTLTMDIDDLKRDKKGSSQVIVGRAKQSIAYIDDMVRQVQKQLQGKHERSNFMVDDEIAKVVNILQHKAQNAGITLHRQPLQGKQPAKYYGDPVRFRQLLINLISNAIDAYDGSDQPHEHRQVAIGTRSQKGRLAIEVSDWGKGIEPEHIKHVFEPFFSTKQDGMGLGLFITKQIAEQYFDSRLSVTSRHGCTTFTLTLKKD